MSTFPIRFHGVARDISIYDVIKYNIKMYGVTLEYFSCLPPKLRMRIRRKCRWWICQLIPRGDSERRLWSCTLRRAGLVQLSWWSVCPNDPWLFHQIQCLVDWHRTAGWLWRSLSWWVKAHRIGSELMRWTD